MRKALIILSTVLFTWSCDDQKEEVPQDSFDRSAMLVNWADNLIIPGYQDYLGKLQTLQSQVDEFVSNPTEGGLSDLRGAWKDAYLAWQHVAMFEIGQAEGIGLQGYTNMYPTDTEEMLSIISSGSYNLELPSRRNQQGLPAFDFMINGLADSDAGIVSIYADMSNGESYRSFLLDLSSRLLEITIPVVEDWTQNGYRDTFVSNDGSSATGAVNKIANDFIYHFEKNLRASKIGIPAGVFSGTPDSEKVEAVYRHDISKELFDESLEAAKDFFNGIELESGNQGAGFASYLRFLNSMNDGEDLAALINSQFEAIQRTASNLDASLANQIETNNSAMLDTYDELQQNVIFFKVDMMQALNIRIDYVDADGD